MFIPDSRVLDKGFTPIVHSPLPTLYIQLHTFYLRKCTVYLVGSIEKGLLCDFGHFWPIFQSSSSTSYWKKGGKGPKVQKTKRVLCY